MAILLPLIGVVVLATVPAEDVVALDKTLVVLDATPAVSGFDAATGAKKWTSSLGTTRDDHSQLHVAGGTVIAWVGHAAYAIDPTSGKVRSLGARASLDYGCLLEIVDKIGVQRCRCSTQLFDVATNQDIGAPYVETRPRCSSAKVLGSTSAFALVSTSRATVGVNVATGVEAWRFEKSAFFSGHSPDARTCWFWNYATPLVVVDCASGTRLWTGGDMRTVDTHVAMYVPTQTAIVDVRGPAKGGVIVQSRDERTGKMRWTRTLPANTAVHLRGAIKRDGTSGIDTSAALLDPKTGAVLETASDMGILEDGHGGYLHQTRDELIAYDGDGNETGRMKSYDHDRITFGDSLYVEVGEVALLVVDRKTLVVRDAPSGSFNKVIVEGTLGPNTIAAFRFGDPGQVVLMSIR